MRAALQNGDVAQLGEPTTRPPDRTPSPPIQAVVVELVDTQISGICGETLGDSNSLDRTNFLLKGKTMTNKEFLYRS